MHKDSSAVTLVMRIDGDAVMLLAQQFRQGALAVFEGRAAQVLAIKLNKIEGAENGGVVVLPVAEQFKDRQPVTINDDSFAVYEAGPN